MFTLYVFTHYMNGDFGAISATTRGSVELTLTFSIDGKFVHEVQSFPYSGFTRYLFIYFFAFFRRARASEERPGGEVVGGSAEKVS